VPEHGLLTKQKRQSQREGSCRSEEFGIAKEMSGSGSHIQTKEK
jgi:hypothetical protein